MSAGKARILLWGIAGAGKSTTLEMIHSKLQADLRGELERHPTDIDPTVYYETLPIQLGKVGGVESQIEVVSVPGASDQSMTRKQLLDEVDGIVLVIDSSPERIDANWDMISELKASLNDYGHALRDLPVVVQYNKRDIADPFQIEDFHRRTGLDQAAVFETIATTGHGILSTLTTISKHVVRARKSQSATTKPKPPPAPTVEESSPVDEADPSTHEILEAAILAEAEAVEPAATTGAVELELGSSGIQQPDWNMVAPDLPKPDAELGTALRIVSAGQAKVDATGGLQLPLVLGDEDGQTRSVVLTLRLDAPPSEGSD